MSDVDYYIQNRERILARQRAYYLANTEKIKAAAAEHQRKNRAKATTRQAAFRARNPHKNSEYHRRQRYGISSAGMAALKRSQQDKCPGCSGSLEILKIHVDHSHTTGKVRGLLCKNCNLALGLVKDNPNTLRQLAVYLEANELP